MHTRSPHFQIQIHVSCLSDDGVDDDILSSTLSTVKWLIGVVSVAVGPAIDLVDVVKHLGRPFTLFPITTTISVAGCSDDRDSSCVYGLVLGDELKVRCGIIDGRSVRSVHSNR